MSFSSKVKEELTAISRKDFTLKSKTSKMSTKGLIREAFLQTGSISDPEKFYHLEIVFTEYEKALEIKQMIESFQLDAKIVAIFFAVCTGDCFVTFCDPQIDCRCSKGVFRT